MTNREWLNGLSDKELAIEMVCVCKPCVYNGECCERPAHKTCVDGIVKWLNKKHIEPMPNIKAGDFIYTKTKEYGQLILVCVKEEEGKILFSIDKEKCVSLSAFLNKEIRKICRYDNKKHCMAEIWRADDE